MQETWVWSLGQEDLVEQGMATHSSILAWRVPWTGEPGGLQLIIKSLTEPAYINKEKIVYGHVYKMQK